MAELSAPTITRPESPRTAWRSAARWRAGTPRGRGAAIRGRVRLIGSWGALLLLVAAALLVPWLAGLDDRVVDYAAVRLPPSPAHPFGTDEAGRDLLVRSLAGLRVSLLVAAACAVISTLLGTVLGALSGLAGGWTDRLLMRLVDAVNAVPHLLLGIVIVALYRGSVLAVIASIALTHWTSVARIVRAEVLSLRDRPFVDAAVS
ncbi:MAG: ABC transporter permease, partial [Pseudonocardiaceae bacterium]